MTNREEKIKCKRAGKYALDSALGPIIEVEEGHVGSYSLKFALEMIESGAWEKTEEKVWSPLDPKEKDSDRMVKMKLYLAKMVSAGENDKEIKFYLQDFGKTKFEIKISRSKLVSTMLEDILTAFHKQEKESKEDK